MNTFDAPEDIVPRSPLQPETMVRLLLHVGQEVTYREAGEVVLDEDGMPVGFTPGAATTGPLAEPAFTSAQWEQLARYLVDKHERNTDD